MPDPTPVTTARAEGFYWVSVPQMSKQIAWFDPYPVEPQEAWSFIWGHYRWPDKVKPISDRLEIQNED